MHRIDNETVEDIGNNGIHISLYEKLSRHMGRKYDKEKLQDTDL
jgi:hypothetical protein